MLPTNLKIKIINFRNKAEKILPDLGANLVVIGFFVTVLIICQHYGSSINSPVDKAKLLELIDPRQLIALLAAPFVASKLFLYFGGKAKLRSQQKRGQAFANRTLKELSSSFASTGSLALILFLFTHQWGLVFWFVVAWLLAILVVPLQKQEI